MLLRLRGVPNRDLVAIEARYHRKKGCYTKYVRSRNIAAFVNPTKMDNAYLNVVRQLVEEFRPSIIENKEVFLLPTLKKRFHQLAVESGVENPDSYKSYNLKRRLMQVCPQLSFIPQPGMADRVCAGDISVGDALCKANELANILIVVERDTSESQMSSFSEPDSSVTEDSIVHSAIGILRGRLQNVARLGNGDYSTKEITLKAEKKIVNPFLYKAINR